MSERFANRPVNVDMPDTGSGCTLRHAQARTGRSREGVTRAIEPFRSQVTVLFVICGPETSINDYPASVIAFVRRFPDQGQLYQRQRAGR
ncbi:MAG: hypothetical protein OEM63_04265 [Gammaproteobacteria bacterium]|nr:hypothetical protein [Gammaproteobacteria bacterium]